MHYATAVRRLRTIAEDCDRFRSLFDSGEGLVVQVVAFRMVTYPSLIQEQLELVSGNAQPL